jgi:esterase
MKLYYRRYGEGTPLIILHGLYGSSDNWVTIAKTLADSFAVYLPDQRNHGQSPHSEVHSYDSMRDDLFELVSDLELKEFFLAGHSMGGKTAVSFALKWPDMLNGLLVADISPFINENSRSVFLNQHLTILESILSIDLSAIRTRQQLESLLSEKIASDRIRGLIMKNLQRSGESNFSWRLNARAILNNLSNLMAGVAPDPYTTTEITGFPVIFLKGERSDYLSMKDFADILKIFPVADFVTIRNSGHWLHSDNPEDVVANIRRLLNDV